MNERLKTALIGAALLAAVAATTWWWFDTMEKRSIAQPRLSDAARDNRMLSATLLLRQNGHPVTLAGSIGELALEKLPDGTLIVGDDSGLVAPDKATQLLAWVRRGNTLVAQPRWINPAERAAEEEVDDEEEEAEEEEKEDEEVEDDPESDEEAPEAAHRARTAVPPQHTDLIETDPIAARLGVRLQSVTLRRPCPQQEAEGSSSRVAPKNACDPAEVTRANQRLVTLPGAAYPLTLAPGGVQLVSLPKAALPAWSDDKGGALRLYAEGRGRIVMVATDYFDNRSLRHVDHGELLLALAKLHPRSNQITIVKTLQMPPWYRALWDRYSQSLIALAVSLALLLWAAMRRFGPMLPEPDRERRALLEHIDASGAWLWNTGAGRTVLLEAARSDTLALIRRRAPALLRLAPGDSTLALSRACGLPEADVDQAMYADALGEPQQFTRQISTLQTLRNHYER